MRRLTLFYGIGGIGNAALWWPTSALLMLYYQQLHGLSAAMVSAVILVVTIFDAIADPLVGHCSDRLRLRHGGRLPLMAGAIVPVTAAFVLLWNPPPAGPTATLLFLAGCLALLRLFDTAFELPHLALLTELTADAQQRVRLLAARSVFEGCGGLAIAALTYNVLLREGADGSGGLLAVDGYPRFSLAIGALILLSLSFCVMGLWSQRAVLQPSVETEARRAWRFADIAGIVRDRPIMLLALITVLASAAAGVGNALNLYGMLFVFQFTQAQMSLLSILFLAGLVATVAAPRLTAWLGARHAAIVLCWTYAGATAIPLLLRYFGVFAPGSTTLFALVAVQGLISAASFAMLAIIIMSLLTTEADRYALRSGQRCEGMIVATNTFARKLAQGLGILIAGVILSGVSFPDSAERGAVPDAVLDRMIVSYLAAKVALFALCSLLLRRGAA